jgi:hypothetical protein
MANEYRSTGAYVEVVASLITDYLVPATYVEAVVIAESYRRSAAIYVEAVVSQTSGAGGFNKANKRMQIIL